MTTKSLVHKFSSAVADDANSSHVRPSNWNADHNFFLGVNAQTGTSYTFVDGDDWSLVSFSNGSAIAVTLPQANPTVTFVPGWVTFVRNLGAGTVTITPTTSTIDGAASLALLSGHSAIIVSDGTNYTTLPMANLPIVVASGKTITINNSLTFAGTDGTTMTFPAASDTVAGLGTAQTFTKQNIHNVATTIASATGAALDDVKVSAATTTITGNTGSPITLLAKVGLYRPTLTNSSAVTVTDAATFYVDNAPLAAGSVTITNPWAILVGAGATKLQATTINGALTYGGILLSNAVTGTGSMVLSANQALTGTLTAAAANFSGVVQVTGTGSIFFIGAGGTGATASNIVMNGGSGTGGGVSFALAKNSATKIGFGLESAVLGSGSSDDFIIRTTATGDLLRVAQATGNVTITAAATITGALTYGGVALSAAVTGTGNMVLSANQTLTGTLTGAIANFSGAMRIGPADTSGTSAILRLDGGSAANGGAVVNWGGNGTYQWYLGHRKAIFGAGSTSNNLILFNAAGGLSAEFDVSTNSATLAGGLTVAGTTTAAAVNIVGTLVQSTGWAYLGSYNAGGLFPTVSNGVAIGLNTTNGSLDMGFYNTNTAASVAFKFWQQTGASAATGLMTISSAGDLTVSGIFIKGSPIANATGLDVTASASGVYSHAISNSHNTSGDLVLVIAGGPTSSTDTGTILIGFNSGNFSAVVGTITRNGAGAVAYNLSSDARGKPNRERLSPALARRVVDALEMYDFDKEGNSIRGYGGLAQQMYGVHRSLATPGSDDDENWIKRPWQAEKAAPMPFVIANLQQLNARMDALEQRRAA